MQILPVNDIFTIIDAPICVPEKRQPESHSEHFSKSNKKKKAATMKTTDQKKNRGTVTQPQPSFASGSKNELEIDTA
jgi:hypothetical protein